MQHHHAHATSSRTTTLFARFTCNENNHLTQVATYFARAVFCFVALGHQWMADGVAVGWFLHSGKQKGEMLPEEHADFLGHDDQNRSDSRPTASLGLITHILADWPTD